MKFGETAHFAGSYRITPAPTGVLHHRIGIAQSQIARFIRVSPGPTEGACGFPFTLRT